MKIKEFLKLVTAVAVCQLAGVIGSVFSSEAIRGWYPTKTPPLNPPALVFGPVWITLYVLMGVALYLVWKKGWRTAGVKQALGIFGFQLVLNALWPIVFFHWHNPAAAFVLIVVLWFSILKLILSFRKISKPASLLLVPYIAWVTFATYLNLALWLLNR